MRFLSSRLELRALLKFRSFMDWHLKNCFCLEHFISFVLSSLVTETFKELFF